MKKLLLILALIAPKAFGQGAIPFAPSQYLTAAGTGPAALYKLCSWAAGTTTPLSTYATAADALAGTNAIAPPRTLDSGGRLPLFLSSAAYKIALYAPGTGNTCNGSNVGTQIWVYDNLRVTPADLTVGTITATTIDGTTVNATTVDSAQIVGGNLTDSALTATRVVFAGLAGLLANDADLTFSGDTLTATKLSTTDITAGAVTDSGLTAGRVPFAGTAGLLTDDSDLTFSTDTLVSTKMQTSELSMASADLALKTYTSGNITLNPAAAATAAVTTNARFEQAMGTTIVSGSCSSGDCTLPGDGNFFIVSGTTAVDGWSTAGIQAGTIVIFTTTGSITFNDSGTVAAGFAPMKLVGGANVSMTADDLILLIYTGSSWDQLAPTLVK